MLLVYSGMYKIRAILGQNTRRAAEIRIAPRSDIKSPRARETRVAHTTAKNAGKYKTAEPMNAVQ